MISRTVFSIKSPRKETCGHAALFRDFLSLADCIFVVIGPLLRWRDCLCSLSEYTSFEPDRLLSRLECFAHWQSRQSPPDGAGSDHAIYITIEPCSRTVSPLHLHGNYHETDPTFFHTSGVDNHSTRLRALTHRLNSDFSSYMRDNGQKRKIVSDELDEDSEPIEQEEGQLLVTESEMREWVKEVRSKLLTLMNSF